MWYGGRIVEKKVVKIMIPRPRILGVSEGPRILNDFKEESEAREKIML